MNKSNFTMAETLDCTIRDGGYLNNWDFDKKTVRELYRSVSRAGVDFIELGYRCDQKNEGFGQWHNVSEELLKETISGVSGVPVALMIDFGKSGIDKIINSKDSLVKMYRVACNVDKVAEALSLCNKIKEKGYFVSLQLMGITNNSEDDLKGLIKQISESCLDYVYFADSYGSLFPRAVGEYIGILKHTGKKIGFHAHNSLQLAFANTLEALNKGIDIVDATVFGMGRGAGNLPLETLIAYYEKTLNNSKFNTIPVLNLIDRYFLQLQKDLSWGYSLPFMLSGILEVHPNYAKQIVDYREYDIDNIVKVLEAVKGLSPAGFKKEIIENVIKSGFVSPGSFSVETDFSLQEIDDIREKHKVAYKDRHKGKDFLILASGPSLKKYKKEIEDFVKLYDPVIVGANYMSSTPLPQYHAFSNKKRFMNYSDQVNPGSKLLISSSFDEGFIREYIKGDFEWIAHIGRTLSRFDIINDVITSDCRTISILLIGVAIIMGARRIFIAGMDGYANAGNHPSDNLHFYKENEEAEDTGLLMEKHNCNDAMLKNINSYLAGLGKEELHIITPTSHTSFYNSILNWIKPTEAAK